MFSKFIKKMLYPHNYSSQALVSYLRSNGAEIGEDVFFYSPINTFADAANAQFIKIGSHVQITTDVKILAHDFSYSVVANAFNCMPRKQKTTVIGSNVFIGMGAIILMGAQIGDNVIIGAGAVVSGNVESNCVYAGNPAVKICTLKQHYENSCRSFVKSAKCYANGFVKKNNRLPEIDEMIIYRCLFCNKTQLAEYANKEHFRGIKKSAKDNIEMPDFYNKFNTIEELMDYSEE